MPSCWTLVAHRAVLVVTSSKLTKVTGGAIGTVFSCSAALARGSLIVRRLLANFTTKADRELCFVGEVTWITKLALGLIQLILESAGHARQASSLPFTSLMPSLWTIKTLGELRIIGECTFCTNLALYLCQLVLKSTRHARKAERSCRNILMRATRTQLARCITDRVLIGASYTIDAARLVCRAIERGASSNRTFETVLRTRI